MGQFGHGGGDALQLRQPFGGRGLDFLLQGNRPVIRTGTQDVHRAAGLGGLANALSEQRMVFAQVRAHDQQALQGGQGRNGRAQITHAVGGSEIGVAQAVVDVFAAQTAHQLAGQVQLFKRAVRADQGTNRRCAMVALDLLEAIGHVFQGGLPVHIDPFAAMFDHGRGQALGGI